jgi:hypothetical protein
MIEKSAANVQESAATTEGSMPPRLDVAATMMAAGFRWLARP